MHSRQQKKQDLTVSCMLR